MGGLKIKILAGFIPAALITMGAIGGIVSWKLNQSTKQQTVLIADAIGAQANERLRGHLNILDLFIEGIQTDVAAKTLTVAHRADVTAYVERYHQTALEPILRSVTEADDLDFAMAFSLGGTLIAAFPTDGNEFNMTRHFNSATLGSAMEELVSPDGNGETELVSAILKMDTGFLQDMALGSKNIDGKGAVALVSAVQIRDDFQDPIGILISGKLLNHYVTPLAQLHETVGSAFSIYMDTIPIASAGFTAAPPHLDAAVQKKIAEIGKKIVSLSADGETYIANCAPLGPKGSAAIATICSSIPESTLVAAQSNMVAFGIETKDSVQSWVLSVGVAGVIVFILLSLLVAGKIVGPLVRMTGAMTSLASGEHDIKIPSLDSRDEIGEMAKAVLVFQENAIEKQRLEGEQTASRQQAEKEKHRFISELADQFERQVKEVVDGVSSSANEMRTTAQQMSAAAEEASRQSTNVATASEQATANVQTVAATAEELSASIAEISRQVSQSTKITSSAVAEIESTNATVLGLAEAANRIGEVVTLINDIAGQTNLLALNATIEAARAGEAGKGFAVVAQEVKNLANQTAKATEDIAGQIGAVQDEANDAVSAIRKINSIITEVNDISTTIASAIEEQGMSTREIAHNVQQAARGTQDVNDNIGSVNKAAGETGLAAGQVLSAARDMSNQADGLRSEVDRFLAEVRTA